MFRAVTQTAIQRKMAVALGVACLLTSSWAAWADPPGPPQTLSPASQAVQKYNHGIELFRAAQQDGQQGEILQQKKLLREARAEMKAALELDPQLADAQSSIGQMELVDKRYKQAIVAFRKALALNPKHLISLSDLAKAYTFNHQTDEALAAYDELLKLAPAEPSYWYNKGCALQEFGRLNEAESTYIEAIRLAPGYQQALFNLATLYENMGRLDEARTFYKRVKQANAGNAIGLEAMHRLQWLDNPEQVPPVTQGKKP